MTVDLSLAPLSIQSIAPEKVHELDVRPILNSGGEPFGAIMLAIEATGSDGAMRLRVPFEPVPLFRLLGSQGWSHWVERGQGDDWIIWFYREGAHDETCSKNAAVEMSALIREYPELSNRLKMEARTWTIDVRALPPPDPIELTLVVADKLPRGMALIQVNERIPQFLFPLLTERGMKHQIVKDDGEKVVIEIRQQTDEV